MKKISLLKFTALAVFGFGLSSTSIAQTPMKESIGGNLGGTRFVITSPASISGIKIINYATWGAAASPTISGMLIEKAYDTLGVNPLLNGTPGYAALTGKFALIFRGAGVSFSQKVNYCIAKGASGVIIVNNIPGDPVGMAPTPAGSTVSVPVLMISDVDGQAISDQIKSGNPVLLTLGTWNTGGKNDLGILAAYQATPHAMNIPLNQMKGSTGTNAYKQYAGGAVANYGSFTGNNITVTDSIFWTPTGGSATFSTTKSYTVPTVSVLDSIRFGFNSASYELPIPTTTGKYEHKYSLKYDSTDDFPQDNKAMITQNITDRVFCRGNYDFVNNRPSVSIGIQPAGGTNPFMFGSLFYVKNGGYSADKLQFSLSVNGAETLDGLGTTIFLYKWKDGSGLTSVSMDSLVQSDELTPVGINAKNFTTADSSGRVINLDIKSIDAPTTSKLVILESNTWYYAVVESPATCFVGMDRSINFFSRSFVQHLNLGSKPGTFITDNAVGAWFNDNSDFATTATNTAIPYPFAGSAAAPSNPYYIDSIFYDKFEQIPSIAMLISKDTPTSIKSLSQNFGTTIIYPNPSVNGSITIDVTLKQNSKKLEYRLLDAVGRTVYSETHNNVTKEKFEMNTSKHTSGNYYLLIVSDSGFDTKKVTIVN